jgi:hypothetical protein
MVPASPYGPALGSKVQQNSASAKIMKVVMRTATTWRYMKTVKSFFSENKNLIHNEKNSGDFLLIKL